MGYCAEPAQFSSVCIYKHHKKPLPADDRNPHDKNSDRVIVCGHDRLICEFVNDLYQRVNEPCCISNLTCLCGATLVIIPDRNWTCGGILGCATENLLSWMGIGSSTKVQHTKSIFRNYLLTLNMTKSYSLGLRESGVGG